MNHLFTIKQPGQTAVIKTIAKTMREAIGKAQLTNVHGLIIVRKPLPSLLQTQAS